MARGDAEKYCFDIVKAAVLSKEICYACSIEDEHLIKRAFQTATPNPESSKFPDFLFDGGFIEHFEVTSSHSNRNGSAMKHEKSDLRKEANAKERALQERMDKEPCYEGETLITDTWHSKHTHEDFCVSFQRSWNHHIESLSKYSGNKDTGVFMVQYDDSALTLHPIYPDIKNGLYYGDLLCDPDYIGYRLSHDSTLLEYIYQFKDQIQFVAFYNNDKFHGKRCEIICVENIPEILKLTKGMYSFSCASVGSAHCVVAISVPNPFYKRNEEDDQT